MPHLTIDYSANLETAADIAGLCDHLRRTAARLEIFPETGVRVRAFRADHVSIADGDPEHGYIDISVRLREGRPQAAKQAAAAALFEAARDYLADMLATRPVMLSLEMRDVDAKLAPKMNTVRDWIARKAVRD
ncbi:MAG: 5-carboxymethyl-2-hydroxymuconate Delta-isomerase [Rhodobacteraceae bacterium]|nr:5-carboxymethyl-2-hydroxymuconate Delta-isomerase [Paracoccaceae bacterium]